MVQTCADRLGRGLTRARAVVSLINTGTELGPFPKAAMVEQDALLAAMGTAQEPSALMMKRVPLTVATGTMQVPLAQRTEQEPLLVPGTEQVRDLLQHGVIPAV